MKLPKELEGVPASPYIMTEAATEMFKLFEKLSKAPETRTPEPVR